MPTTLGTVGALVLSTVTETGTDAAMLPTVSNAIAERPWVPSPTSVVFQATWYGGVVTGAPICESASKKVTLATPTLSDASARTVTIPDTVPPVGDAMLKVGGMVSAPD